MSSSLMVTGAAGFIGSNFVRRWRAARPGDRIVAVDALTYAGNRANLAGVPDVEFVEGRIGDLALMQDVMKRHEVGIVVNFAAESHNSYAVMRPDVFFRTNVVETQALLEAARRQEVRRFHHVSTCEVYGDLALDADDAFTEESPYRPNTPYSASKAGADHAVRAYHATFGLPVTISNCANNYGPYQFPEKVVPLFTTRALAGEQLPMYRSVQNRREWIHVADHCDAIARVIVDGAVGETYHVGTGREATIEEIADLVLEELALPETLKSVVPDRPGHDRRYRLDSTKIRAQLGWAPKIDFEAGIKQTVRWYADHPEWWQPLVGKAPVVEEYWKE